MIYSEDYWKKEGEGKKIVPISTGLSWVRMEPLLANAQSEYLLPLLGEQLNAELDGIYEMRPTDRDHCTGTCPESRGQPRFMVELRRPEREDL